ncbi:MAG: SET domain-containing protein-lysine N-methyltransferase [Bdellovibrionales bacterium]
MSSMDVLYAIDAKLEGNETRFINHSSHAANSVYIFIFHNLRWRVLVVASKTIKAGEQVLSDYGKTYWSGRQPPKEF